MITSEIIATGAIVIAIIALVGPLCSAFFTRRNTRHQALIEVHKDFRSPEMMSALDDLNNFYRKCKDDYPSTSPKTDFITYLKTSYELQNISDNSLVSQHQKNIGDILRYKRRLITHFYIHLASVHKHKILPPKMIFDWWVPDDFLCFDF